MALHCGTVKASDGNYVGPVLNRIARLVAAGHGGQILLSSTVYQALQVGPHPDVTFRDLGTSFGTSFSLSGSTRSLLPVSARNSLRFEPWKHARTTCQSSAVH
jgi:hypothetical protein